MKKFIPILISVIFTVCNVLTACANDNVLRSVDVNGNSEGYTIKIASTKAARITKNILSSNRIIINIKDLNIADNVITKYNGSKIVDNVMIEPSGENDANILIQGDNIVNSNVEFVAPTKTEQIQDGINSSINTICEIGATLPKNRVLQFGIFMIFGIILLCEIRFIKNKYDELEKEKEFMKKEMERAGEFKDFMQGFGNIGINKPYTTPVYTTPKDTSLVRANYLKRLHTNESQTLNELLHAQSSEQEIIDKITSPKIIFGTLSNINKTTFLKEKNIATSNPIKSNVSTIIKQLEKQTKEYTNNSISEKTDILQKRLNKLY